MTQTATRRPLRSQKPWTNLRGRRLSIRCGKRLKPIISQTTMYRNWQVAVTMTRCARSEQPPVCSDYSVHAPDPCLAYWSTCTLISGGTGPSRMSKNIRDGILSGKVKELPFSKCFCWTNCPGRTGSARISVVSENRPGPEQGTVAVIGASPM